MSVCRSNGLTPSTIWATRCRPRQPGERDGEARRGRHRLSRGVEGTNPRARAARLGIEPENLGYVLFRLGERESGTARLEEAVIAYREALKERTRERAPLDWAFSFGNGGVTLLLLAERRGDAAMAETALRQINAAFETMRDSGNTRMAAYYEQQLSRARAIVARLRGQ